MGPITTLVVGGIVMMIIGTWLMIILAQVIQTVINLFK